MKDSLATTTLVLTNPVLKTRSSKLSGFTRRIFFVCSIACRSIYVQSHGDFRCIPHRKVYTSRTRKNYLKKAYDRLGEVIFRYSFLNSTIV